MPFSRTIVGVLDKLTCETVVGGSRIPVGLRCLGSLRDEPNVDFEPHTIEFLDLYLFNSQIELKFPAKWDIQLNKIARCTSEVLPDSRKRSKMTCIPIP